MNVSQLDIDNKKDLHMLGDHDVLHLIRRGNSHALDFLIHKYRNFVRAKARTYFLIGADKEDIVQKGYDLVFIKQFVILIWTSQLHLKRLQNFVLLGKL